MNVELICVTIGVLFVQLAVSTVYKDCGTDAATVASVDVSNCPNGTIPCPFKRNTNVTLNIQLTATEDSKGASQFLYGYIAGIKTPFPTPKDACQNNDIKCPITKGTSLSYSLSVLVRPEYPKLRLVVELDVTTDDGKHLVCAQIPAEITD